MALRSVSQEHVGQNHGDQAHAWPTLCHAMRRIFLTAPPSYAPVAFSLRPDEKHLCYEKLAISSIENLRCTP